MATQEHEYEHATPTCTDASVELDAQAEALAGAAIARLTEAARRRRHRLQVVVSLPFVLLLLTPMISGVSLLLVPSISIALVFALLATGRHYRMTVDALAERDDVRLIGPMVDAMAVQGGDIRAVATEQVARLLPRLQPADAPLLKDRQRRTLDSVLLERKDLILALAILNAYAQIGDAKSLPVVESLASGGGRLGRDRRVREAALDCLPQLRARAITERAAHTLLRPTSGPRETDPSVLLRPAEPKR
jgi:hypothetical protein